MASDQERPIEKLLRRAARERREQGGGSWELHPASRRVLQGEVAKRYPQEGRGTARALNWGRLWPRLAWAGGLCILLALTVWMTQQDPELSVAEVAQDYGARAIPKAPVDSSNLVTLASPEPGDFSSRGPSRAKIVQATSQPLATAEAVLGKTPDSPYQDKMGVGTITARQDTNAAEWSYFARTGEIVDRSYAAISPGRSNEATQQGAEKAKYASGNKDERIARGLAMAEDIAPATANGSNASAAGGRAVAETASVASSRQEEAFYGNFRANMSKTIPNGLPVESESAFRRAGSTRGFFDATGAAAQVLEKFQLNQRGEEVVVVDNDGSVYRGRVESVVPATGHRVGALERVLQTPAQSGPVLEGGIGGEAKLGDRLAGGAATLDAPAAAQYGSTRKGAELFSVLPTNSPATDGLIANPEGVLLNFQVVGTNNTLSRKVNFAGILLLNNSGPVSNATHSASQIQQAPRQALPVENQVVGRLTVDGSAPQEIQALQVP